jgi:Domain of unknown function (DUF397)
MAEAAAGSAVLGATLVVLPALVSAAAVAGLITDVRPDVVITHLLAEIRAPPGGQVEVRNSRFPDQARHIFAGGEWDAFLAGVRAGEFDPEALSARAAAPGPVAAQPVRAG